MLLIAIATNNADTETAMGWVISHMEDPDFNDPPTNLSVTTNTTGTYRFMLMKYLHCTSTFEFIVFEVIYLHFYHFYACN